MRGRIKTQVHASVSCKWIAGEPRQEAGRRTGNAARTHPTTDGKNFMKQEMIATSFQQIHSFNWAWPLKSKPPTKACSVFLLKGLSWQMERRSKSSKIKKLFTEPRQGSHQWLSYPDLGSNHPDSTDRECQIPEVFLDLGTGSSLHVQSARKEERNYNIIHQRASNPLRWNKSHSVKK